ncbi:hypothetical protein [Halostella litorea]|uniref:hypothetical protein n=1 Tax=Halostella litorea TaxID=2528831 RepID=UPI0010920EFA|nr:hypothetical protein [Halostella litorea]
MDADAAETDYARLAGLAMVLTGTAHLLVPGLLLRTAQVGYGAVLDARFDPGDATRRRVRLLGLGMVAAGAHLLYHGGVRPRGFD